MADTTSNAPLGESRAAALLYNPAVRGFVYQLVTVILVVGFVWWVTDNTITNLQNAGIASGFGFLDSRAGFDIAQTPVAYNNDMTYGRALVIGIINTVIVSVAGIVTATIIGFIVGIGRLSSNWLVARLSEVYVEIFRNIPPLLVIFFFYTGVLALLPSARDSIALPLDIYLNNRGLAFPTPIFGPGSWLMGAALVAAIVAVVALAVWSKRRQMATGQQFPTIRVSIAILILLPLIAYFVSGMPVTFDIPVKGRFNLAGGAVIGPEFMSLYLALSLYTAAFMAEIIRGGILGVAKGQTEAAGALGLHPRKVTRLVVVPQAMRIIIPPMTSEYLSLTKNSSLAVAIGYADIVAVGKTVLNQTGQAVEVVTIWMIIYLTLSILTSIFMNWFNAKMALVER
ncbi:MAG: amino acid ABC transporter permease [Martelella sp.]|uniref:amino acid ABC transporter permease n=1 Tax=unclassified Martelella TaxID=2629616 RepID=UPI000C38026B|nr:amino acid ABC transporter permease [Martelella sp.]MAU21485.1 amino acid ABC transporter permease [Martelella sp.]|tara:strand:+ start:1849 stop:3042 length:1194 start_codon:yes stop_codon:yes gene_type:complete